MSHATVFETLGNVELLSQTKVALFASKTAPAELCGQAREVFRTLLRMPITLAGGWQAPLEKSLFNMVEDRFNANVIYYLGRNINEFKPSAVQQLLITENKLLVIAPVLRAKRTSQYAIRKRDALIFSQVKKILFLYIQKGGQLEKYYRQLSALNYQLYLLDHQLNQSFNDEDLVFVNPDNANLILEM